MYALDGVPGQYLFVKYIINALQYGHVHLVVLVYFVDTLRAEISFGNHFHLHFGGAYRVSPAYHGAEVVIPAESGVGGYQQVAQINRVADVPVFAGRHGLQETVHLVERVGDEHGLEVVAALHAVANTGGNGVDVFQYSRVFDSFDVGRDDGFQFRTG